MQYNVNNLSPSEKRLLDNVITTVGAGEHAHSYIFEGGTTKSRMRCAIYTACAVCCTEKHDGLPCLNCSACRKILAGEHSDIEILGEDTGVKDIIPVDEIRRIRKEAYILPSDGDYHIYIIADANKMNAQAQNAFLKVLEEPPENVLFILLVSNKETLLSTVTSRAMTLSLGNGGVDEAFENICAAFPEKSKDLCKIAAKIQVMLDKYELDGKAIDNLPQLFEVVRAFYVKGNRRITENLPKKNEELVLCLYLLALGARDLSVARRNKSIGPCIFDAEEITVASKIYTAKKASELYAAFSAAADRVLAYGNTNAILSELNIALRK